LRAAFRSDLVATLEDGGKVGSTHVGKAGLTDAPTGIIEKRRSGMLTDVAECACLNLCFNVSIAVSHLHFPF